VRRRDAGHRELQALQQMACLPLRLAQHRRLTMTGSSRRAAKEQSQHHKQLASYSAYKRRVGADLSGSAARVAISVCWGCTRCFWAELCNLARCDTCRYLVAQKADRHSVDTRHYFLYESLLDLIDLLGASKYRNDTNLR
jgi:hypothetical protein